MHPAKRGNEKMCLTKASAVTLAVVLCFAASASAQTKVESIDAAPAASEAIVKAVSDHALRVNAAGNTVQLWPAKSITGEANAADGALYPDLPRGTFAGVIQFSSEAADFRGQKIKAGTYTLRYAVLPSDGNHLGVAPSPDFFLLVPAANDVNPDAVIPYPRLIRLSARAAGTNHPAAFSLTTAAKKSPSINTNEKGHVAVTFELNINGKTLPAALIVVGVAEQ
jgi:hypothetical protein